MFKAKMFKAQMFKANMFQINVFKLQLGSKVGGAIEHRAAAIIHKAHMAHIAAEVPMRQRRDRTTQSQVCSTHAMSVVRSR